MNELVRFANATGVSKDSLATAGGILLLVMLFIFGRLILRTVTFVIAAIISLAFIAAAVAICLWVYSRFGVVAAAGAATAVTLVCVLIARLQPRGGSGLSIDEYWEQDEDRLRDRERQLREDERIRRNHYG